MLLISDIFLCPYKYLRSLFSSTNTLTRQRECVCENKVYVCVHEWGGYSGIRKKKIKSGKAFNCGLNAQLERYKKYRINNDVELTVTMSEPEKSTLFPYIKENVDNFIPVSNQDFDFSGYHAFYETIKNKNNAYVILSNSSVENEITDFLYDYINYMKNNLDIGLLGISYSTKMRQTLIRNNFTPHIQSFFILTTLNVLKEIVKTNNNRFPGIKSYNKILLIRNGEIKMSQLAQKLGYNLCVVHPDDGKVYKFAKNQAEWTLSKGDLRLSTEHPNRITPIALN